MLFPFGSAQKIGHRGAYDRDRIAELGDRGHALTNDYYMVLNLPNIQSICIQSCTFRIKVLFE